MSGGAWWDGPSWRLVAAAACGFLTAVPLTVLAMRGVGRVRDRGTAEARAPSGTVDEMELEREQLARTLAFFGDERMARVRNAFVVVVGVGGVGSHAAALLARNGVGRLRIIDFDQVSLSSLNRHAVAMRADVGEPKVDVLKRYLAEIAPFVEVQVVRALYSEENADELLAGSPDFVLDCIDNITTKAHLLKYCHSRGIPVLGSMGAGAKGDPSRIQVADLAETTYDPLSKAVRRRLRKDGVEGGIPVVFSSEIPEVGLLPLDVPAGDAPVDFQLVPDFRVRILPVLGPMPAMFGAAMAAYVLQTLSGKELRLIHLRQRDQFYHRLWQRMQMRERDVYGGDPRDFPLDTNDIAYLMEEIWRSRSALSGSFNQLTLVRWDRRLPPTATNIVPMTLHEADRHDAIQSLEDAYPKELRDRIAAKFEEERRIAAIR